MGELHPELNPQPLPPGRYIRIDQGIRAMRDRERRIAAYTSRLTDDPPSAGPALGLLRYLADQARLGQLLLARPDLIRSPAATLGLDRTEQTLHRYLRARPPQRWTAREGERFASWLAEDGHAQTELTCS
jgi:uncharacterized protein